MSVPKENIENYIFNKISQRIQEYLKAKGKDYNYTLESIKVNSDLTTIVIFGKFKYFNKEVKSQIELNNFMKFLTYGLVKVKGKEFNDIYQLDKELGTPMLNGKLIESKWQSIVSLRLLYLLHTAIKDTYYVIQLVLTKQEVDRNIDYFNVKGKDEIKTIVNYYQGPHTTTTTAQLIDAYLYYEYYKGK